MPTGYLTIDDAPSADLPEKLSILDSFDVPTLFFCEGRRLSDYPDHARQAVEAGFSLGNHTYSHRRSSELSVDEFRNELARTESLLNDVYDQTTVTRPARMFRFPYGDRGGDQSGRFQEILEHWGFRPPDPTHIGYEWYQERHADGYDWYWTWGVEDWNIASGAKLRARVDSASDRLQRASADIVLFHDDSNSPAMFECFIERLRAHGVELADPLDLLS